MAAVTLRFMDLGTVASWIGAGISAVSAGVAVWKVWWDRPEAGWEVEETAATFSIARQLAVNPAAAARVPEEQILGELINVGDGDAFDVEVACSDCQALLIEITSSDARGISVRSRAARVRAGDCVKIVLLPRVRASHDWGATTQRLQEAPESICAQVRWTRTPTWRGRWCLQDLRAENGELTMGRVRRISGEGSLVVREWKAWIPAPLRRTRRRRSMR